MLCLLPPPYKGGILQHNYLAVSEGVGIFTFILHIFWPKSCLQRKKDYLCGTMEKIPDSVKELAKSYGYGRAIPFGFSEGVHYYYLLSGNGGEEHCCPTGMPFYIMKKDGQKPVIIDDDEAYELMGHELYGTWHEHRVNQLVINAQNSD